MLFGYKTNSRKFNILWCCVNTGQQFSYSSARMWRMKKTFVAMLCCIGKFTRWSYKTAVHRCIGNRYDLFRAPQARLHSLIFRSFRRRSILIACWCRMPAQGGSYFQYEVCTCIECASTWTAEGMMLVIGAWKTEMPTTLIGGQRWTVYNGNWNTPDTEY